MVNMSSLKSLANDKWCKHTASYDNVSHLFGKQNEGETKCTPLSLSEWWQITWQRHGASVRGAVQICISIYNTKTIHTLRFWLIESFVLFRERQSCRKKNRLPFASDAITMRAPHFLTLCTFHGTIVNLNITKWIYFYSVAKYPFTTCQPEMLAFKCDRYFFFHVFQNAIIISGIR